ncbi:dicarboxylate/amino acid:cation symporter [bacterium]|nr:dicarboxylate/amino acid:cation symporter [bacterium]
MPDRPKHSLHRKIFIGLLAGVVLGLLANFFFAESKFLENSIRYFFSPFGQIFLRLIFMTVIPLIFCALALGVAELGDARSLGRIGLRTFGFTVVATSISVLIGITAANWIRPGDGISESGRQALMQTMTGKTVTTAVENAGKAKDWVQTLLDVIPRNPLADAALAFESGYNGGGILAVMFFALFLGVALALARSERTLVFEQWLQGMYEVVMKMIHIAMKLAPYGVAALVFSVVAKLGIDVVFTLGKYVAVVMGVLALQFFGVYGLILRLFVRVNPWHFFKAIKEVIVTAFSTSSSNVTLPTALRVTEHELGVPSKISRFVLTLGATANQNGTALYEGITVLFLAQFFGVELSFGQQMTVVFAAILAGIGTAGVPGGSLPVIVLLLQSVGVPGEGIGIILGVDRILDMSRTVINVSGDITAAAYVAKAEGAELTLRMKDEG